MTDTPENVTLAMLGAQMERMFGELRDVKHIVTDLKSEVDAMKQDTAKIPQIAADLKELQLTVATMRLDQQRDSRMENLELRVKALERAPA